MTTLRFEEPGPPTRAPGPDVPRRSFVGVTALTMWWTKAVEARVDGDESGG